MATEASADRLLQNLLHPIAASNLPPNESNRLIFEAFLASTSDSVDIGLTSILKLKTT